MTFKIIYTDASGSGEYAYVVEKGKTKIFKNKSKVTHNENEYMAIIQALKENPEKNIRIYSDAQLIINQLNHKYAIKEDRLRKLAQKVWKLAEGRNVHFYWVSRKFNLAGKVLG